MSRTIALLLALLLITGCSFVETLQPPGSPFVSPSPTGTAVASPAVTVRPTATPRRTSRPTPRPTPTPAPTAQGGVQTLAVGQRDRSPSASAADVRATVRGNTEFAIDLYQRLRRAESGNIVVGPYSISVAFAMQDAGALGRTARQIERVLHFTLPTGRLDAAFNKLSLQLEARQNKRVTLSVANRLFGAQLFRFQRDYLREITRNFAAPMAAVDFTGNPEAARKLINRWVAGQTAQRIKDLIPREQIKRRTKLVLVNATYMKARWATPFLRQDTWSQRFYLADGRIKVPTMHQSLYLPSVITADYTAVELPYAGGKLAMLIVMPTPGTLTTFERSLDGAALRRVVGALEEQATDVALPRFSIRTRLALADTLREMGMTDAFDPVRADFYGISAYPRSDPYGGLFIAKVFHQAFITVAEKGTEAAAATAIIDEGTGGGSEVPPLQATIDHPFLWFVRDRVTGSVLFMGRVMDPSQTAR